jgi:dihydrodipicolinate synthase/N-acetylneuraminate lyase
MLVTPFTSAGSIDWDDLRRQIDYVRSCGSQGTSALGLGGEVGRLTEEERRAVAELVLETSTDAPVVIGCTAQDTDTAVRLAVHAAEHGASALMVAPASRADWGRDALLAHYATIAKAAAPTPLMIQDAPSFVGVSLDEGFMLDLASTEPNVLYAKPEGLPAGVWSARLATAGLTVFGGQGGLYVMDVLEAGATGLIPGPEAAGAFQELLDAWRSGRRDDAWATYLRLLPLLVFEFQGLDHYIACGKALLQRFGVIRNAGLRGNDDPLDRYAARTLFERAARAGLIPATR